MPDPITLTIPTDIGGVPVMLTDLAAHYQRLADATTTDLAAVAKLGDPMAIAIAAMSIGTAAVIVQRIVPELLQIAQAIEGRIQADLDAQAQNEITEPPHPFDQW